MGGGEVLRFPPLVAEQQTYITAERYLRGWPVQEHFSDHRLSGSSRHMSHEHRPSSGLYRSTGRCHNPCPLYDIGWKIPILLLPCVWSMATLLLQQLLPSTTDHYRSQDQNFCWPKLGRLSIKLAPL